MPELGEHFEFTLQILADRLVTPERFGAVALEEVEYVDNVLPFVIPEQRRPQGA